MWQNNRRIVALWTINQTRNAWVRVQGLGWRKLENGNNSMFLSMVTMCTHAKADNRPVSFLEVGAGGNIEIREIYVW